MIDSQEVQAIRRRSDAAKRAVDVVEVHVDGGLFGEIPLAMAAQLFPATVSSARDVPRLLGEVERLSPAEYIVGPEGCCEGDCEDEEPSDGQWCSHVTEKVATFGHVRLAESLDELVKRLRDAAVAADRGDGDVRSLARAVIGDIDWAYEVMAADDDIGPVVAAAGLVGAEPADSPHEGDQGHGGGS